MYFIPSVYFHLSPSKTLVPFFNSLTTDFLPLLNVLDNLETDGVDYALTLIISPLYLNALTDEKILTAYGDFLRDNLAVAKNTHNAAAIDDYQNLLFWLTKKYRGSLIDGLMNLVSYGHLEIITTTATTATLSLLSATPIAVSAQINLGAAYYEKTWGQKSNGIFLPTGSFYPEIITYLNDFNFAIIETNTTLNSYLTTQPLLLTSQLVGLIKNAEFSATINFADNIDADQHANQYLTQLINESDDNNEKVILAIYQTHNSRRIWRFFNLLLRKLCYDQQAVKMIIPSVYLTTTQNFARYTTWDWLTADLTDIYLKHYDHPELPLAALQLSKLKATNFSRERLSLMAQELLLAQSGDHTEVHLNNFTNLAQNDDLISQPNLFNNVDLLSFY